MNTIITPVLPYRASGQHGKLRWAALLIGCITIAFSGCNYGKVEKPALNAASIEAQTRAEHYSEYGHLFTANPLTSVPAIPPATAAPQQLEKGNATIAKMVASIEAGKVKESVIGGHTLNPEVDKSPGAGSSPPGVGPNWYNGFLD